MKGVQVKFQELALAILPLAMVGIAVGVIAKGAGVEQVAGLDPVIAFSAPIVLVAEAAMLKWLVIDDPFGLRLGE